MRYVLVRLFRCCQVVVMHLHDTPIVGAIPTVARHVVHEERDHKLMGWTRKGINPISNVPVRISMARSKLECRHDLVMEV